jgi:hypothetical protein
MSKFQVILRNGLVGCDRVIDEINSDDYDDIADPIERENEMYDIAYELAQEHVEVELREINEDPCLSNR